MVTPLIAFAHAVDLRENAIVGRAVLVHHIQDVRGLAVIAEDALAAHGVDGEGGE